MEADSSSGKYLESFATVRRSAHFLESSSQHMCGRLSNIGR